MNLSLNSAFEDCELISPEKEAPNLIQNEHSFEESEEEPPLTQRPSTQPPTVLHTVTRAERPQTTRVLTQDLGQFIRSKRDLWQILSNAQLLLPAYECTPMNFLKAVLAGEKKLLTTAEAVCPNVPKLSEFSCQDLYRNAMTDENCSKYLPDPVGVESKRSVCRRYLFTVIHTNCPHYFDNSIKAAQRKRKEKYAMKQNQFIDLDPQMLQIIKTSDHVMKSTRGRALQLLNVKSRKRRTPQQVRDDFAESQAPRNQFTEFARRIDTAVKSKSSFDFSKLQPLFPSASGK